MTDTADNFILEEFIKYNYKNKIPSKKNYFIHQIKNLNVLSKTEIEMINKIESSDRIEILNAYNDMIMQIITIIDDIN